MIQKSECVFCKIVNGEIKADIVMQNEKFVVFKDIHPESEGHCLIIPKEHYNTFLDLPQELYTPLLKTAKDLALSMMKKVKATGFKLINNNFKSGGQVVEHYHLHLIPKK